jgi:hypothetical protein
MTLLGGTGPMIVVYLISVSGVPTAPAWYVIATFDRRCHRHPGGTRTCAHRADVKDALANELRSISRIRFADLASHSC